MKTWKRVRGMRFSVVVLVLVLPFATADCTIWVPHPEEILDECFAGYFREGTVSAEIGTEEERIEADGDTLIVTRVSGVLRNHDPDAARFWSRLDFEGHVYAFGHAQVSYTGGYGDPDDPSGFHANSMRLSPADDTLECLERDTLTFVIQYWEGLHPEERYTLIRTMIRVPE